MKDIKRNQLTQRQRDILCQQRADTSRSETWLHEQGLNVRLIADGTHIRLLKAQQQAHIILAQHLHLLTASQVQALQQFKQHMANARLRSKLKPTAANLVLNISSKVNRQLFKQHRHLIKAQA